MGVEWGLLREWAGAAGVIFGADFPVPGERGGREHQVRYDDVTGRWWKHTKPNSTGLAVTWENGEAPIFHNASPAEYLERLLNFNELFADGVRLEGLWRDSAGWRVVTTQRGVVGGAPSGEDLRAAMEAEGWTAVPEWNGLGYEHSLTFVRDGWLAADVHPSNALRREDGKILPIDFIITRRID